MLVHCLQWEANSVMDPELAGTLQFLAFCLSLLLILNLVGLKFRELHSDAEFGKVPAVCFFPTCLDLPQTRQGPNKS